MASQFLYPIQLPPLSLYPLFFLLIQWLVQGIASTWFLLYFLHFLYNHSSFELNYLSYCPEQRPHN